METQPTAYGEEQQQGLSTELELYTCPWKIVKKLTKCDVGHQSRLLLDKSSVEQHVLPFMTADNFAEILGKKGFRVVVFDIDTYSMHHLVFKKWEKSSSFVLIGGWPKDFVRRRELQQGDVIGMCWDKYFSRFNFHLLNKAM